MFQTGISDNLLTLAYEPKAAAIYCKEMIVQRIVKNESASMDTFKAGQKFLVLDCGGNSLTRFEFLMAICDIYSYSNHSIKVTLVYRFSIVINRLRK